MLGMKGYLKTTGWIFKLHTETTTIGRHRDCDLCLQNGGVEDHHALVEWSESQRCFILSDLNSANGTYVNDCRVHNAAVRLAPGDELHFGYGGSTYQLVVDNPSLAWVIGQASVTPRPPSQARPASAGAKRIGSQKSPSEKGPSSGRPGNWTGITKSSFPQRKTVGSPNSNLQNAEMMQHLIQEKEERLLRLGDELRRVAVFEVESQRKDVVIAGLRDEMAALRHQLTQSTQDDPGVKNRLRHLERDISGKKEQIQQLKEQMVEMQRTSVEFTKQSGTEKDLKISSMRGQIEKLKRDSKASSGLLSSLQRDLSVKEKEALLHVSEMERLRQDLRHRDTQLAAMATNATKFAKMSREHEEERSTHENEVLMLKKMESERQGEKQRIQAELQQMTVRVENFRSHVLRAWPCCSAAQAAWSDQQSQLQESFSLDVLERALVSLQDGDSVSLHQGDSVSSAWSRVQAFVFSLLGTLLSELRPLVQTLGEAGIDVSNDQGVFSCIRAFSQEHQTCKSQLQHLKGELEKLQGSDRQMKEMRDQLNTTRQELDQQRQLTFLSEQEAQSRQREEFQQAQEVETKQKELHSKLQEAERNVEAWQVRASEAQESGREEERERCRVQELEYREQVRQHAHTIVALEQRWSQSREREKSLEEERESLRSQLRELEDGHSIQGPAPLKPALALQEGAMEDRVCSPRADLAQAQLEVQTQGDIIAALSCDLVAANARITDMTGELSEQQKLELEQHRAVVVEQRVQLSTLTHKLTMMSQLVEQKGEELRTVREEMRQCQLKLEEKEENVEHPQAERSSHEASPASQHNNVVGASPALGSGELTLQGSKCRGHRHDEVIEHQREALVEMRARTRALELTSPLRRHGQQVGEETLERMARLDLSDALDLSDRTYLDLARCLCEALELSEAQLEGQVSLQHVPQEERTWLGTLRQQDLELLRGQLALQHSQAQHKDTLLQEQSREISSLRETQAEALQLRASLASLRTEMQTQTLEVMELRQAGVCLDQETDRQAGVCLDQETDPQWSGKGRKTVSQKKPQKKTLSRVSSHSCVPPDARNKVVAKATSLQEKQKRRQTQVESLKTQLAEKKN
ncbi:forkhead-associated domain-containing protein 1 [Aplochiton taeniatus]